MEVFLKAVIQPGYDITIPKIGQVCEVRANIVDLV
jgi:hypothetical protein